MPVPAPWARPGSGFTLLFEAWAVEMARHLPVSTLAEQLDETDTRLWRSVAHYVLLQCLFDRFGSVFP